MKYSFKKYYITNALDGAENDIVWKNSITDSEISDSETSDSEKSETESNISDSDYSKWVICNISFIFGIKFIDKVVKITQGKTVH